LSPQPLGETGPLTECHSTQPQYSLAVSFAMLRPEEPKVLSRQYSLRCLIVAVLIAALFAGLFFGTGSLPALLTAVLVVLLLLFSDCPLDDLTTASLTSSGRSPAPARAPPTSSL
jgi:fatty acid desaturase